MFSQFQAIEDTSVAFTTNKKFQGCVGKLDGFKISDTVGTSICRGYAVNMVMNPTLDIFSAITRGGWNSQGENFIILYVVPWLATIVTAT